MNHLFIAMLAVFSLEAFAAESRFGWSYGGGKPAEIAFVEEAATLLQGTPTGNDILTALKSFPISVSLEPAIESNGYYDDENKDLVLNADLIKKWPKWKLARLLAHELTHAVQHSLGIDRANYDNNSDKPISSSGIAEFAALSMEVRFWIEAGAPIDKVRDFNSLRMRAYLFFPETVRVGWAYSNSGQRFKEPVGEWADERLAKYWKNILASEATWRDAYSAKFPAEFKKGSVALEYLENRFKKPVSSWMPEYLENPGELPGKPTANDRELIAMHRLKKD